MLRLMRSPPPLLLGLALATAGCTQVGPDFTPPPTAWLERWQSPALQQVTREQSQADFRQWWRAFDDPLLDRLIAEADAHNPSLQIAGLRVLEARAALGIAQSTLYPQLQQGRAESIYLDRNQSGGDLPRDTSAWQYQAGFNLGWELDFWGRFSRAIESADATYLASQANYQDVLVLLRAQVAQTYFALRTAEARLRIARENAGLLKRSDEFTTALYYSAVNFATLGYGDIVMSAQWRLLGPIEAANGVLMFGVSTAAMLRRNQLLLQDKAAQQGPFSRQ